MAFAGWKSWKEALFGRRQMEAQPSLTQAVTKSTVFKTVACSSTTKPLLVVSATGAGKFVGLKGSNGDRSDTSAAAAAPAAATNVVDSQHDCPVDREQLGNSTWTFLHTMAAYVPDKPTRNEQKDLEQFMSLIGRYYPCDLCANGVREHLKTNPPKVCTRQEFSQWMCRMHNEVNVRLGKPEFDCSRVDERWRDGWKDGHCD